MGETHGSFSRFEDIFDSNKRAIGPIFTKRRQKDLYF